VTERKPGGLGHNALKLGLFGSNCSGGLAFTTLAERWEASWDNNLALAMMSEAGGLECMVPVARWKGFGGATNVNAISLETITWACGLLAHTQRMTIFGTIHVPMIHPVVAAKQIATVDHVGRGRFGVNLVCGWNQDEFEMFGISPDQHDDRYARGEEWWTIIKTIWSGGQKRFPAKWTSCSPQKTRQLNEPADFDGKFYQLRALEGSPSPFGNRCPRMMNAGASPAGRMFAIRNSDLHFDYCRTPKDSAPRVQETKQLAKTLGRTLQVWIPASIVCRRTQAEADDYAHHCVERADWDALDHQYALYAGNFGSRSRSADENRWNRDLDPARTVLGYGGSYSIRGDADHVAHALKALHDAGFDGVAMGFVNYLDELPYFIQEVIPRLQRIGLRAEKRPGQNEAGRDDEG
jgi:alkanesulfonate monooxygenase SsuD/methylene tetrahydromethanopterin reductase-like flavin-dependent oxidoreductase (luciferase family)